MYGRSTQSILLVLGTPNADPDRSGPSLAIVVNQVPYRRLWPRLVRRAAATHYGNGIKGIECSFAEYFVH